MYKRAFACRCRRCRTRVTLRQHPERYMHRRHCRCPRCGADALSVDQHRTSGREHKRTNCTCGHYPWPHRRGSLLCAHGAMGRHGYCWWTRNDPAHRDAEETLLNEYMEAAA